MDLEEGFNASLAAPTNHYQNGIDELPIFAVDRAELNFSVAADFVAGQVANDVIILALSNGRILRIDLNRPEDIDGQYMLRVRWDSTADMNRHRFTEETVRDWRYPAHVPRSHSFASDHLHYPGR